MRHGSAPGSEPSHAPSSHQRRPPPRVRRQVYCPTDQSINTQQGSSGHPPLTGRSVLRSPAIGGNQGKRSGLRTTSHEGGWRRGSYLAPAFRAKTELPAPPAAEAVARLRRLPEQDADELDESQERRRRAQAKARPVLDETECNRSCACADDDRGPEPPALEMKILYESTIASIASATSPARNGIPRTRLKPVASTRNSARTNFCS
jgi:hypothetical protein